MVGARNERSGQERDEPTPAEIRELQADLLTLKDELERLMLITRDGTRPVDLDEPIGRLTRMEAIQQQSVTAAGRRSLDLRLRQVVQALGDIDRDRYGICRRCEDPIGYRRLKARPESPYCLDCQDEIDRKHG